MAVLTVTKRYFIRCFWWGYFDLGGWNWQETIKICLNEEILMICTFQHIQRGRWINPLAPNDVSIRRTAQLITRRFILNIYSTNILTEYFKHTAHSPFFFSSRCRLFHNAIFFGSCNIHILYTGCAKNFKENSGAKGLKIITQVVHIVTMSNQIWSGKRNMWCVREQIETFK